MVLHRVTKLFRVLLCCLGWSVLSPLMAASAPTLETIVPGLAQDFEHRVTAIEMLGQLGGAPAQHILDALEAGHLGVYAGQVVVVEEGAVKDALTQQAVSIAAGDVEMLTVNNRIRQTLASARANAALSAPEVSVRLAAAKTLGENPSEAMLPLLDQALAREQDAGVRAVLAQAWARAAFNSADAAQRLKAVETLSVSNQPAVKVLLAGRLEKRDGQWVEPSAEVRAAAQTGVRAIEKRIAMAEAAGTLFSGLSLGSILLLAALGLAITYGVMGIINMAHGELLMVGAYTTYAVQTFFRHYLPGWVDAYVFAAIPLAFLSAALVGVAMERLVLRHLYGRTIESLLATWGISLILIQAARLIFGPQNVELANPAWMSGGFDLGAGVVLPYNRVAIILFAIAVLGLISLLMQKTRLGLFVRAVTQNRAMAGCVGVHTGRVDTLAFALGSGVAGLGGLALSQVGNVGPAMGTGYIVDAFMVVVLGGVGQLAGAVWAALGLGIVAKFLEGWAGAVVAKILVLVFIIIFIQKRPQGIFALKGRFAES